MQLLLCLPSADRFEVLIDFLNQLGTSPIPKQKPEVQFVFSTRIFQHDLDIAFIGESLIEVNFKTTKLLQQKYHLALKAGFCEALKGDLGIGTIVNVIKEKPILFTTTGEDIYTAGMLNRDDYPHFRGSFVNMNNSYMNVFLDFKKVVSGTVQSVFSTTWQNQYLLDTLTYNGIGFVYPCMFERQPFYQVNAVYKNNVSMKEDISIAETNLNKSLIDILQKL